MGRKRYYKKGGIATVALAVVLTIGYMAIGQDTNSPDLTENEARVIKVADGDTITINYQGQEEKVRLIGIDTPESVHPDRSKNVPFGKVASDFTKSHLLGEVIQIELDAQERDKYGRLLAYVYLDGKMFNETLLEEGMAVLSTYPPNVKYVDRFTDLERTAREKNKGLWGE
jgi:micrococcal nuclease